MDLFRGALICLELIKLAYWTCMLLYCVVLRGSGANVAVGTAWIGGYQGDVHIFYRTKVANNC